MVSIQMLISQHLQTSVIFKCPLCSENFSGMDILKNHVIYTHFVSPEVVKNVLKLVDTTEPEVVKKNTEKALEGCKLKTEPVENLKPVINGPTIAIDPSTSVNTVDKKELSLVDSINVRREISSLNSLSNSRDYKDEVFSCVDCGQIFAHVKDLFCHQNKMGHLDYTNMPKGNCSKGQELVSSDELDLSTSLVDRPYSALTTKICSVKTPEVLTNEISLMSPVCQPITSSPTAKTSETVIKQPRLSPGPTKSTPSPAINDAGATQRLIKTNPRNISVGLPIPINLGMNLPFAEATNMQPPLIPHKMPRPTDTLIVSAFGPLMMPGAAVDPKSFAAQQKLPKQQQLFRQKRRTWTSMNDQLKILRAYFDINNSPTEDQLLELSGKSRLPLKIIKRWFQNMLLKERQKIKATP